MSKLLISVSGVRGIVGESLTPNVLTNFASAFAEYTNKGKIVVGRDTRKSGVMINDIIIGTLRLAGCDVIDVGIVPTPTVGLMVKHLDADGGIVITASHNPAQWNALKFFNKHGMFLAQEEMMILQELYHTKNFNYSKSHPTSNIQRPTLTYFDQAADLHIDHLFSKINIDQIKNKNYKVFIDSCNGAGSEITPDFLRELGCEVIEYNCDVTKEFPRDPEPVEKNLGDTIDFAKRQDIDIAFIQDPDADRVAILDETGRFIGEEYSLALAAMYIFKHHKTDAVANVSTSMMIDKIAEQQGAKVFRSRVGEINVSTKMQEIGALIGGEGNGGVICPIFHYCRDSLVGIVLTLLLLTETDKKVSELVDEIPEFVMKKEKIEGIDKETYIAGQEELKQKFTDCVVDETDGTKFIWEDKWVQVRASNTEPVVRVIAEAFSTIELENLFDQVSDVLCGNIVV